MMSSNPILSIHRDIPLLIFLWKWKIATTSALHKRYFLKCRPHRAYCRLLNLTKAGYLDRKTIGAAFETVWTLTEKGFNKILPYLPSLKDEGFRSENIHHDLITQAVHLGEWLQGEPEHVKLFSEQQLRRYDPNDYLPWVPKDKRRRPDGYWRIDDGKTKETIALEVELNRKPVCELRNIAEFYAENEKIDRVLWAVLSERTAIQINSIFEENHLQRKGFHDFLILNHFLKSGWDAQIILGPNAGKKIKETLMRWLSSQPPNVSPNLYPNSAQSFGYRSILDTRKTPFDSNGSEKKTGFIKAHLVGQVGI